MTKLEHYFLVTVHKKRFACKFLIENRSSAATGNSLKVRSGFFFLTGEDGGWSSWSNPPCDKTCGGGRRVRRRTCTNPPPSGDGADCQGSNTKSEPCNTQPCKQIIVFIYSGTRLIRTPRGHDTLSVLTGVRIKRVNCIENV